MRNACRRYGIGLLAAYICVRAATKCVHEARQRCSRGAVGDLTALLRRCRDLTEQLRRPYGVPTARISQRRATARTLSMLKVRPWHGDLGYHMTSNGDATELLPRSRRPQCARYGVLHFPGRRTVSARRGRSSSVTGH